MDALEEARALKDQSFADRHPESGEPSEGSSEPPRFHIDYSPAVEPPPKDKADAEDDASDEEAPVESRYSRNSARLPRIGVDASSASDTIANLRKQMTAED